MESVLLNGGGYYGCSYGLMNGVDVGDRAEGDGGSSEGEGLWNLGRMFIMDVNIFE